MRKVTVLFLVIGLLLSAAGCSVSVPEEKVFSVDDYQLQITADSTYREATGGSFDLQITNNKTYISIMAYKYMDLPTDVTPQKVFDMQNEELFSKREAVKRIEEAKTQKTEQYTITQALYSAEKDGAKNYYATYLIDFADAETFAWILVTAAPSYLTANRDYLHNIVCSLTVTQ